MNNNKMVLKYCPNFDRIINTDFLVGDNLSSRLIDIYKDFIFKIDLDNEDDINKVIMIDRTMGKYVDDYSFRKTLQEELVKIKVKKSASDMIRTIVDNIIKIFKRYEENATRKIYISRWI